MNKIKFLWILFIVLMFSDIALTFIGINYFGFEEGNPLMKILVDSNNWLILLLIKIFVIFFVKHMIKIQTNFKTKRIPNFEKTILILVNLIMIVVCSQWIFLISFRAIGYF